ncbi:MAG: TetR/AcrR family transcriptional regulator [Brachybacterium sp.]
MIAAATEHILEHGVGSLSLRTLAQSVGISHATLLHHFANRETLVAEVVDATIAGALSQPDLAEGTEHGPLRALWTRAGSAHGRRYIRLFIELTGISMFSDAAVREAVSRSMGERHRALAAGLERECCPTEESAPMATWMLSAFRGLMAELIITGDQERSDAAFEDLHRTVMARAAGWGGLRQRRAPILRRGSGPCGAPVGAA